MLMFPHITLSAEGLSVAANCSSSKKAWNDVIKLKVFGRPTPVAMAGSPRSETKTIPFLNSQTTCFARLANLKMWIQRQAVGAILLPHGFGGFRYGLQFFWRVAIPLGILIAKSFAFTRGRDFCFGLCSVAHPKEWIVSPLTVGSSHVKLLVGSENRVNSVEHLRGSVSMIQPHKSTPSQAMQGVGCMEGVTARLVSPNNNPTQERPARKGRYSLNCLATDRSGDKKLHDNITHCHIWEIDDAPRRDHVRLL